MKNVKCKNCGRVHFEVSLKYCIHWENEWTIHFKNLDDESRSHYGLKNNPPKIEDEYLNCQRCNNSYKDFIDAELEDVPNGSTIGGILCRDEDTIR